MLPVNENINVGATVSYMKDIDVRGAKKNAVFGEIGTDIKFNDDWHWMAAVSKSNIKAYNDAGQKIKNDGVFTEVRYKSADWKRPQFLRRILELPPCRIVVRCLFC